MRQTIEAIKPLRLWQHRYNTGRKKPISYFTDEPGKPRLHLMGHYEATCGGCDNIGSANAVYEEIAKILMWGHTKHDVLCEGLLLSEDTKWTMSVAKMNDVRLLYLNTPLQKCLDQVQSRRAEAGNFEPLNQTNTSNRYNTIERGRQKLVEAGVTCRRCSVSQVPGLILKWLVEARVKPV